jgi:DNA repair photolyase
MIVKEISVKGVVTKSKLPGVDYVINPYIGCQHGCIYCYAEFMKRFTNHHEKWGEFIDVKANALDVLGNIEKYRGKRILFSSVTDPYHPVESKYKLTRKILEALIPVQPIVEILTKGRMFVRDIDLLKQYNDATVGISIVTVDEKISREIEPIAATPKLRLDALKRCKESGLKTCVFFSPIFPYITDIEEIVAISKDYVDYFMFENLNVRPTNLGKIYAFLNNRYPELVPQYKAMYEKKDNAYWDDLEEDINNIASKYDTEALIYFHHGGFDKKN